jgi:tetratricopeptide (TPR) repeat protein
MTSDDQNIQPGDTIGGDNVGGDKAGGDKVGGGKYTAEQITIIYQQARDTPADPQTIAATRQLLGQMPTAALPPHTPLPPSSRMPFTRNTHFVGRAPDLLAIAQAFGRGAAVAVTGLGGLGKTSVATEFVHRYGQFFAGGVFWLSFAEPATISAEVAQCGAARHLALYTDAAGLSLPEQVAAVRAAWRQDIPRLLVFDNCDADEIEEVVREWTPASGDCRILITSRRGWWSPRSGVEALPLHTLPRPECIALLHQHRPDLSDADADEIAQAVGDLPLALYLAGSYLERYRTTTPAAYLERLRSPDLLDHPSLKGTRLKQEHNPTTHDLHIGRSFAVSYTRLDATDSIDALALALLARAAYFAPGEPIPRTLLLAALALSEEDEDEEARLDAEDALHRLLEVGLLLVDKQDGSLTLHRLLAAFVQGTAGDEAAQAAVEEAIYHTVNALNKKGIPQPVLMLQNHLRHVTDQAKQRSDEKAAQLCSTTDYHLGMIGNYSEARIYSERALAIREQVLGPEHPDTALSLNNLAGLLRAQGDYAAARPLSERALAIWEQVLGPDHPHTATSLNNLAGLLRAQGDYAAARPLSERALAIWEQVLGPDHPLTATSLNNLALLLRAQGDYAAARPLFERALAIYEQVLGPEHPLTALSLNNLAGLLRDQGDYAAARPLYERALAITEQVLGPEHPHTQIFRRGLEKLLAAMESPPEGGG